MTLKEFLKKAGKVLATFLSGMIAAFLFIAGRKSAETEAACADAAEDEREETFEDAFRKEADEARENTKDIITLIDEHDVADMYPAVWDSISRSRELYRRKAGEIVERKRSNGAGS